VHGQTPRWSRRSAPRDRLKGEDVFGGLGETPASFSVI
jgi:hypothetical protein